VYASVHSVYTNLMTAFHSHVPQHLPSLDDGDDDGDTGRRDDDPRSISSDVAPVLSYRHISSSWDFGPLIPSLAAPSKCYHTNVGRGDRTLLATVAAACATFFFEVTTMLCCAALCFAACTSGELLHH
jgi:hypothetical protein